ncbi:hypothetical protein PGT21_011393 [Puccinia graminis f. sp. tritici]|uniref:Uncharacterized protein n=1 Tax=Puccinia graminis f. sp. tritici TaxID=56615 RepID=A0A5B0PU75_PUCGR|nr:hypothetical protein PGT21_011393 [Puccinia graminis f. sp. tritici]KAA1128216.1 hypothetical protein PGTUg99_007599 [Puccinia graminis f. sp. tritici]
MIWPIVFIHRQKCFSNIQLFKNWTFLAKSQVRMKGILTNSPKNLSPSYAPPAKGIGGERPGKNSCGPHPPGFICIAEEVDAGLSGRIDESIEVKKLSISIFFSNQTTTFNPSSFPDFARF